MRARRQGSVSEKYQKDCNARTGKRVCHFDGEGKKDSSKMTNPESIVYGMTVKDPANYVAHRQRTSTEQSN